MRGIHSSCQNHQPSTPVRGAGELMVQPVLLPPSTELFAVKARARCRHYC